MNASTANAKLHRPRGEAVYRTCVETVALATVATIPWSTSATSILVPLWAVMAIPTLSWPALRAETRRARSALPVLLALLGVAGLLWSEADWHGRLDGVDSFARFLLLPLFAVYFQRSGLATKALATFLASCGIILVISLAAHLYPPVTFWRPGYPVVPFKDATTQSLEFALCAFGLIALVLFKPAGRSVDVLAAVLAVLFLVDIVYVATSRTELVAIALTLPVLAVRRWGVRGLIAGVVAVALAGAVAWYSSENLRARISHGFWEYQRYETMNQGTSIGARLEFWRRSLLIISQAPLFGHGTGSIEHAFAATAESGPQWIGTSHEVGTHVARAMVTPNPHNQTFAVGIQLGLLGIAVLYAMWLCQLWSFRGPGLVNTLGIVVWMQFVIGSVFYSYLFDFTEAWLFILGNAILFAAQTDPAESDRAKPAPAV
jgi:O-antigen ligase